ncbi:unnamed protein product [Citrullus colocynthis]|uniref:Nucleic acid binding NABP domain-containing protein n=1 Tax=Citrullus colocynthis TaxID=252529 RepID=A0ABP0XVD4_9ROSI
MYSTSIRVSPLGLLSIEFSPAQICKRIEFRKNLQGKEGANITVANSFSRIQDVSSQTLRRRGIGDRRDGSRGGDEGVNGNGSLFMLQPGVEAQEDSDIKSRLVAGDWTGDGLIGLPGLGLWSRKKSIATSCNAFEDILEASESQFAYLHQDMATIGGNKQGISEVQGVGASTPHTYASTVEPPCQEQELRVLVFLQLVGGYRTMDKRRASGPNSFNGVSLKASVPFDLVSSFSGMNLSTNGILDDESQLRSDIQLEIDNRHNFFNLQTDQNDKKSLNHNFYGNQGYGLVFSYPGSPLLQDVGIKRQPIPQIRTGSSPLPISSRYFSEALCVSKTSSMSLSNAPSMTTFSLFYFQAASF